jgi:hypothetical protein
VANPQIIFVEETVMKYRIAFNMGEQVTLKEESASGVWFWSAPNVEADNTCITLVNSEENTNSR